MSANYQDFLFLGDWNTWSIATSMYALATALNHCIETIFEIWISTKMLKV